MAATNVLIQHHNGLITLCSGTGAIAATDTLVTDKEKFPMGSRYIDNTARIEYVRIADALVIGDWAKSVALTVHS